MKKLILLPALAMFACVDAGKETGEDSGTDTTDTTDTADTADTEEVVPSATASVTWGDSSVALALTVENGLDGAEYYWGIAQTNDCTDCWTGEDCHGGYLLGSGSLLEYCHPIDADGGELFYGGDPNDLSEGAETVFSQQLSATATHIVDDQSSAEGPCWTWGADTSYYSDYEKTCTEM